MTGRGQRDRVEGQLNIRAIRQVGHLLLVAIIAAIVLPLCSGLLCSQCTHDMTFEECMTSPPEATPCESTGGSSGVASCQISKIYMYDVTGELVGFHRGCTAARSGRGCMDHPPNRTLCFVNCVTDNCNGAVVPQPSSHQVLYIMSTAISAVFSQLYT